MLRSLRIKVLAMSRIGNDPITIPEGVTIEVQPTQVVVKGKLGELTQEYSDVEIKIPSSEMASIISQLQIFGDSLDFICSDSDEKIQVVTQSSETGKMEVDIINSAQTECQLKENVDMKVSFAIHRMHDICSNSKVAKQIEFSISDCFPIRIKDDVGGNGKMLFYLAPKVSDT